MAQQTAIERKLMKNSLAKWKEKQKPNAIRNTCIGMGIAAIIALLFMNYYIDLNRSQAQSIAAPLLAVLIPILTIFTVSFLAGIRLMIFVGICSGLMANNVNAQFLSNDNEQIRSETSYGDFVWENGFFEDYPVIETKGDTEQEFLFYAACIVISSGAIGYAVYRCARVLDDTIIIYPDSDDPISVHPPLPLPGHLFSMQNITNTPPVELIPMTENQFSLPEMKMFDNEGNRTGAILVDVTKLGLKDQNNYPYSHYARSRIMKSSDMINWQLCATIEQLIGINLKSVQVTGPNGKLWESKVTSDEGVTFNSLLNMYRGDRSQPAMFYMLAP